MLPLLIYYNRTGKLCEAPQGGFLDKRSGPGRLLCGVYRFMHKRCQHAFPALSKKEWLARRSRKPLRAQKSSSKRTGSYCHVQVQHALLCGDECRCEAKGVVRKQSPAYLMVQAAKRFIAEHKLVPLCGEMVIVEPNWRLGTKFDMLCERAQGQHVLVSWKTTGLCPFLPHVKSFSAERLVCHMPTNTTSSEMLAAREHASQVCLCTFSLHDAYQHTDCTRGAHASDTTSSDGGPGHHCLPEPGARSIPCRGRGGYFYLQPCGRVDCSETHHLGFIDKKMFHANSLRRQRYRSRVGRMHRSLGGKVPLGPSGYSPPLWPILLGPKAFLIHVWICF